MQSREDIDFVSEFCVQYNKLFNAYGVCSVCDMCVCMCMCGVHVQVCINVLCSGGQIANLVISLKSKSRYKLVESCSKSTSFTLMIKSNLNTTST